MQRLHKHHFLQANIRSRKVAALESSCGHGIRDGVWRRRNKIRAISHSLISIHDFLPLTKHKIHPYPQICPSLITTYNNHKIPSAAAAAAAVHNLSYSKLHDFPWKQWAVRDSSSSTTWWMHDRTSVVGAQCVIWCKNDKGITDTTLQ